MLINYLWPVLTSLKEDKLNNNRYKMIFPLLIEGVNKIIFEINITSYVYKYVCLIHIYRYCYNKYFKDSLLTESISKFVVYERLGNNQHLSVN